MERSVTVSHHLGVQKTAETEFGHLVILDDTPHLKCHVVFSI